jgi:hypothetical protein
MVLPLPLAFLSSMIYSYCLFLFAYTKLDIKCKDKMGD